MTNTRARLWDDIAAAWVVGETLNHVIHIVPMIYNHRVVLTPKNDPSCYDVGWCYDGETAAFAAVEAWNLATMREPVGYTKRIDWRLPKGSAQRRLA